MRQWYLEEQETVTPVAPVTAPPVTAPPATATTPATTAVTAPPITATPVTSPSVTPSTVNSLPVTTPSTVAPTAHYSPEHRFDPATVQRAVELASEFKADSLTFREIEQIAEEAGIESPILRRALAQAEYEKHVPRATATARRSAVRTVARQGRLTRRKAALMFGIPAIYGMLLLPILYLAIKDVIPSDTEFWPVFAFFILPPILTVVSAALLGRIRQGMAAGIAMAMVLIGAVLVASAATGSWPESGVMWLAFAFLTVAGATIGGTAAAVAKYFSRPRPHWLSQEEETEADGSGID